ncbi:hypothetical protein LSUE1_G000461 [Lachnellula suecica]|uniref:Xylanolytic transcriptional activator regulatory domain-containing protein n=1 Tax=Lachnellula suecica TaxID=602035 RepID=A0A8T9CJY2_9HELO|nr:hypothetical protein LSUE1_G000461 [Lachnellula suecica]
MNEQQNNVVEQDPPALVTSNLGSRPYFDAPAQDFSFTPADSDITNGLGFLAPDSNFSQDLDFGRWDFDLEDIELAYEDTEKNFALQGAFQLEGAEVSSTPRGTAKRFAAFERSLWLWRPTSKDQTLNDQDQQDLILDEENIPSVLNPLSPVVGPDEFGSCCITSRIRDQMFGIVLRFSKFTKRIPSFPSLTLLNDIIRIYFVQESYMIDSLIHPASIVPSRTIPQLYLAIIAQGSTLISTPAIWRMGFALSDVVNKSVVHLWEENNSVTRSLQTLQAYVMFLDIGLWSGFKRKMEIAESMAQPVISMLRRAGSFVGTRQTPFGGPQTSDSEAVLESKWRTWAEKESYKRLALHLFIHDTHASAALQKPPLITFTELKFELPASRELWLAKSATSWRDLYLASKLSTKPPSFLEAMHNPEIILQHSLEIDVQLTTLTLLHGYWCQIHSLLESKKFYPPHKATHRLCLLTAHTELYRDIGSFTSSLPSNSSRTILISHLFMMILHISPEDLQRFAGKFGEDDARKASSEFQIWVGTAESRVGIWHAGQVIRAAGNLMPAQLRGFNAVAIYYAALALWVYGLMPSAAAVSHAVCKNKNGGEVVLNKGETAEVRDFRASGDGIAGLSVTMNEHDEFVPLTDTDRILYIARELYRGNLPVHDNGLPPLVESLGNLLRDLSDFPKSRASSAPIERVI